MKLKKVLVLLALAGAVVVATAQGISKFEQTAAAHAAATKSPPVGLVQQALDAGNAFMDALTSGSASEATIVALAGVALVAAIIRGTAHQH